jgi:hypothetical protein
MEPDRHRHRRRAEVVDLDGDVEHTVAQPMRHLDGVRERKLRHPVGLPQHVEPAGYPRRPLVGLRLDHLPDRPAQETVDGMVAAHVAETHVQRVALAVGVERLLVETIGPRRQKRDAERSEDVVAVDRHRRRQVTRQGRDRHRGPVRSVLELHEVGRAAHRVLRRGDVMERKERKDRNA